MFFSFQVRGVLSMSRNTFVSFFSLNILFVCNLLINADCSPEIWKDELTIFKKIELQPSNE